ncbi:hypothetical protein C8J55DRAFT_492083 [Lentinula edodes]|uniref:Uncharacterized protein n=1 Tax=Lentinula lateritia TaxID=40482 RepID=A0A9W8ZYW2_9AGAR|nr:hypothetical protein C8J55DRAFT_492083 [Lentinula edodes]
MSTKSLTAGFGVDPQQFWLLLNPLGSAQLTWLLDNPPGFWTIQLALSTAPEQNHPLFLIISYPIRCRSAPFINCALCTHFGKRAQNRRRMGQAYFTRLWTSAERSGNSATPTTSLEGEPSGTNSVRVPTVCGYLLFRSREGGGQNPYHISYWRLFARIDLELFVLNSCNSLKISCSHYVLINDRKSPPQGLLSKLARPEFPERRASRYLDTSDVSTSEHLDIDDVSVSRCLDIDDVSVSRCLDIDDVSTSRCLDIDDVSTSRCPDIGLFYDYFKFLAAENINELRGTNSSLYPYFYW